MRHQLLCPDVASGPYLIALSPRTMHRSKYTYDIKITKLIQFAANLPVVHSDCRQTSMGL